MSSKYCIFPNIHHSSIPLTSFWSKLEAGVKRELLTKADSLTPRIVASAHQVIASDFRGWIDHSRPFFHHGHLKKECCSFSLYFLYLSYYFIFIFEQSILITKEINIMQSKMMDYKPPNYNLLCVIIVLPIRKKIKNNQGPKL